MEISAGSLQVSLLSELYYHRDISHVLLRTGEVFSVCVVHDISMWSCNVFPSLFAALSL